MHLATPATVAIGLTLVTGSSGGAFAQNSIVNGDFDSSLAGWSEPTPTIDAAWTDALDAGGSLNSGSALLQNASEAEGSSVGEISQCIPISPDGNYRVGGSIYLPDRRTAYGYALLDIIPYDAAGCEGPEGA